MKHWDDKVSRGEMYGVVFTSWYQGYRTGYSYVGDPCTWEYKVSKLPPCEATSAPELDEHYE